MANIFKYLYIGVLACLNICQGTLSAPPDELREKYNLNRIDHCKCLYDMAVPYFSPEISAKYDEKKENITKETLTEIAKYFEENIETFPEYQAGREIEFLRHIKHYQYPLDGSFTWNDINLVLENNGWQLKPTQTESHDNFKIVKNPPELFYYSGFSKKDLRFLTDKLALSVDEIFKPIINKTQDDFKEIPHEDDNNNKLAIAYFTLRIILGEGALEDYISRKYR